MQLYLNKKTFIIIIIFLMFPLLTGCWNRKELGELGVVGAAAIDAENNNIKLTIELIQPKNMLDSSGSKERASYFQSEGETIFDAVRNATLKTDKKLYWPHASAYFFNEEVAKTGMATYLDFFNRDHESKRYVNIAIAKGAPAYDLIGIAGTKSDIPSMYVESLFKNSKSNGKAVSIKLMDFLKTYYEEGIQPVVGVLQVVHRNESNIKAPLGENGEYMLSNEGCAVFNQDKMVGFLNGVETRGYNFVLGKIESAIIISPSPDGIGKNSVEVIKSSSEIDTKVRNEKIYATVSIKINGMLGEESGKEDIANLEAIKKIEESTSNAVKIEVLEAIKKVQFYKSDVFGFGSNMHRNNPNDWDKFKQNWQEVFSTLNVDVIVKTNVQRFGAEDEQLYVNKKKSK